MNSLQIDGYHVVSRSVGKGCSGAVFQATDAEGQLFAAKRYNSMSIDRHLMAAIFRRYEKMPPHEGVLPLLGFQFHEPPYFSLTEFDEGGTLSDAEKIPEKEAWDLIVLLAEAMGHAHKFGVVHGNLHPGNVFYGKDPKGSPLLRVGDFGAGMIGEVHHIDLDDTAYFAPPEQLECYGHHYHEGAAERWDVYRFGAIAYWILNQAFPRGQAYLKSRAREIACSGGRPVPLDPAALAHCLRQTPTPHWKRKLAHRTQWKRYREVIERCLDLDPDRRPVDLREVRNEFRDLESEFTLLDVRDQAAAALNEAENRVRMERLKQKTKLFGARAVATILGASCIIALFYLVTYFRETQSSHTKITELDQVVANQKAHISILGSRWEDAVGDLKQSREAADASFYIMTRGAEGNRPSGQLVKELERSRTYYIDVLKEVSQKPDALTEKGRALHSLAHIEKKLSRFGEAKEHFSKAVETFDRLLLSEGNDLNDKTRQDTVVRLADCHENIGILQGPAATELGLASLTKAVAFYKRALASDPDDSGVTFQLAESSFQLGRLQQRFRQPDRAVSAFSDAAITLELLRSTDDSDEKTRSLDEMLSRLRFHTAQSLAEAGRAEEAIDSYIAAVESVERLRGPEGFSPDQTLMLASSFYGLGDLFRGLEAVDPEEKDQVYNEALRLLVPLNRDAPGDLVVAKLMSDTLMQLALLEREAGEGRDGYRLSVRSVEVLIEAARSDPENLEGYLNLATSRLGHLSFLMENESAAVRVALEGVENLTDAHRLFVDTAKSMPAFVREETARELRGLFGEYSSVCSRLGRTREAEKCSNFASFKLTAKEATPTSASPSM